LIEGGYKPCQKEARCRAENKKGNTPFQSSVDEIVKVGMGVDWIKGKLNNFD